MNKEKIIEKILEQLEGYEVTEITKTNGIKYTAFVNKENEINPLVYLEEFIDTTDTEEECVEAYLNRMDEVKDWKPKFEDVVSDLNKEYILNHVNYIVVNYENNKELLKDMPHRKFLDLAIMYVTIISYSEDSYQSLRIHNKMMEQYDLTEEELYNTAIKNAEKPVIKSLFELLGIPKPDKDDIGLYIISNETHTYGAKYIINKELLSEFCKMIDNDFILIIPSSVHELIVTDNTSSIQAGELNGIINSINAKDLDPQQVLSNHAYYFDAKEQMFSMPVGE